MTGNPIRSTKFASWIDEDAWMETMKGEKWNHLLKEEERLVQSYTSLPAVKNRISKFLSMYKTQEKNLIESIPFRHNLVDISWQSTFFKTWSFLGSTLKHECRDILITPYAIFCTVDIKNGEEYFELQCWTNPYSTTPDWKISPVGPDLGYTTNTLYYLGVKNRLMYYQVWSCDVYGKHKTCLYTESSDEVNLSIHCLADERCIFSRENSQDFEYFELPSMKRTQKFLHPPSISSLNQEYGIDWIWPRYKLIITKEYNKKTLWNYSSNESSPKKLLSIPAGEIFVDPFAAWKGTLPCLVHVNEPTGKSYYTLTTDGITLIQKEKNTLKTRRIEAKSKDNTTVFGIITYKTPPKYLLAIGYGSYGMPGNSGPVLTRWGPLIKTGWAILYTFLRGGGDHTDSWAKAGRVEGRTKTIEDFEALVQKAQSITNISPINTTLYGRSAGGLLMGGSLANHPNGTLMSAVYAEVPYVDELRTTTNADLPLTTLEHKEFGNPKASLKDFISVAMLSPADTAIALSTPKIFVLSRTAEHDSQVFSYEPVKWIRRLRKLVNKDAPKLCIVEKNQGHFTPPDLQLIQWAVDCALLDSWIHNELPSMR